MVVQSPNLIQFAGHGWACSLVLIGLEGVPALLKPAYAARTESTCGRRLQLWPKVLYSCRKVLAIWVERPFREAAHLLTLAMALSHAEQVFGTHAV